MAPPGEGEEHCAAFVASAAAGDAMILLCGMFWLATWTHSSFGSAFALAVLPFLPGDALKVVAAAGIAKGLDHVRRRN